MKRILLISDTHGHLDQTLLDKAREADEVWHAGDWGDPEVLYALEKVSTVRGVYGNIDGREIRNALPRELYFRCEGLGVYMVHIGGYPGRYQREVKEKLMELQPNLYICGHSHILKVVRDKKLNLLHFNPGAIGLKGFHRKRTLLTFQIDEGQIDDLKVLEYEKNP